MRGMESREGRGRPPARSSAAWRSERPLTVGIRARQVAEPPQPAPRDQVWRPQTGLANLGQRYEQAPPQPHHR